MDTASKTSNQQNKPSINPTAVYGVKEAAELLSLHDRTVQELIGKKQIQARLVGNKYLILGQSLINFLQGVEESPEN